MQSAKPQNIVLFGDEVGAPVLFRTVPREQIVAFVAAEIRPRSHESVQALCSAQGVPLLIQPLPKNKSAYEQFVEQLEELSPDLFLVYSYSMLLRKELLELPAFGSLNIHGGKLPEYRGSNPIQWAILNKESEAGTTLHKMVERVDAGPIIAEKIFPLAFTETWREIATKVNQAAEELLLENLPAILDGKFLWDAQEESRAHTWPRRHPEDGEFTWEMPLLKIYNLIRALVAPLPGAFVTQPDGSREVFDSFLSLAELAVLKNSRRPFRYREIRITPHLETSPPGGLALHFSDRGDSLLGEALIEPLDYEQITVQFSDDKIQNALRHFCETELEARTF